jgi:hypothetical protein
MTGLSMIVHFSIGCSYPEFPDNCLENELLVLEPALDARAAVLGPVEEELRLRAMRIGHEATTFP